MTQKKNNEFDELTSLWAGKCESWMRIVNTVSHF